MNLNPAMYPKPVRKVSRRNDTPSEPGTLRHEDIAERAIDDDVDEEPIDFGDEDDDGGNDPKPDDDSKKTPIYRSA